MPVFNNILAGSSGQATGYTIDQSLRFNDDDSAYLSRTAGTATSNDIGTFSFWTKRGNLGGGNSFFSNHSDANNRTYIGFDADTITMFGKISGSANVELLTTPVFRDPGAWYHIVIAVDVTQSSASNRVKIYVNGTQITDFGTATYPAQNTDLPLFSKTNHQVGAFFSSSIGDYYDGYFAEYHYIDGQQLAPSSFAETNSDTNQWEAIEYEGSYGNNGFYLKFQDSSALGDDSSGNTNDFTPTNLAATDVVADTPTNNFATFFPTGVDPDTDKAISEGNLKSTFNSGSSGTAHSTLAINNGNKWYAEFLVLGTPSSGEPVIGIDNNIGWSSGIGYNGSTTNDSIGYVATDGKIYKGGTLVDTESTFTTNDIIQVAFDGSTGRIYFGKNNTWQNSGDPAGGTGYVTTAALEASYIGFACGGHSTGSQAVVANFGQDSSFAGAKTSGAAGSDFYYTPPTGYKALNTDNFSDPAIALPTDHFNTVLYTGDGTNGRTISGVGFQPDWLWNKSRSATGHNMAYDSVRGSSGGYLLRLNINATSAETATSDEVKSFTSDGFITDNSQNASSVTYIGWNWKAGGTASSNTDGSITSSVSANATAGFSIVSFDGNGTSGATVGHGLSQAPELIIVKGRNLSGSSASAGWVVYSKPVGNTKYLYLNETGAEATDSGRWNDTTPTASVFTLGDDGVVNTSSSPYIAYCFHSVEGYSKVGSYTGNGNADGPMIHTGMSPAFVLVRKVSGDNWAIYDNARDPYNVMSKQLYPDSDSSEETSSARYIDFVSNGIKIRGTNSRTNTNGETYIYLAFAESPFKTSNAR